MKCNEVDSGVKCNRDLNADEMRELQGKCYLHGKGSLYWQERQKAGLADGSIQANAPVSLTGFKCSECDATHRDEHHPNCPKRGTGPKLTQEQIAKLEEQKRDEFNAQAQAQGLQTAFTGVNAGVAPGMLTPRLDTVESAPGQQASSSRMVQALPGQAAPSAVPATHRVEISGVQQPAMLSPQAPAPTAEATMQAIKNMPRGEQEKFRSLMLSELSEDIAQSETNDAQRPDEVK